MSLVVVAYLISFIPAGTGDLGVLTIYETSLMEMTTWLIPLMMPAQPAK